MTIEYIAIEYYQNPVVVELEDLEKLSTYEEVEEKVDLVTKNLKAQILGLQQKVSMYETEKITLVNRSADLLAENTKLRIELKGATAPFWHKWL